MKLKIKTNDYRKEVVFPIFGIKYLRDENNIPIDITIAGDEDTLKAIGEFSSACNVQEIWDFSPFFTLREKGATHEALYARLNEFEVILEKSEFEEKALNTVKEMHLKLQKLLDELPEESYESDISLFLHHLECEMTGVYLLK